MRHSTVMKLKLRRCLLGVICTMVVVNAEAMRLGDVARCNYGIEGDEIFIWDDFTMIVVDAEILVAKAVGKEKERRWKEKQLRDETVGGGIEGDEMFVWGYLHYGGCGCSGYGFGGG
ncbi:hypothetical protein HAX54_043123 [Datura stramonium]|uniref:Uncharacterized protein n=1 Tax=Datura stramonium TaxID=4076 RepID=A0ABS8SN94_DATST|nr:hypothetical protein [Datura stramonium]